MNVIVHGRVRALRAAGRLPALRRVDHARRARATSTRGTSSFAPQLAAAGLFDDDRKRPIPRWPRRIGVVTSPVGAVWRDINNVLRRRYPLVELVLSPSVVQGATAAPAIVRALQRLYAQPGIDVVILARGGGSLEDLWGFNDERVVRAVADARRCRSSSASGTSRTSPSPTSRPTCARRRRVPPPSSPRRTGRSCRRSSARFRDRAAAALIGRAERSTAVPRRGAARARPPGAGHRTARASGPPISSIAAAATLDERLDPPARASLDGRVTPCAPFARRDARARATRGAARRRADRARRGRAC